MRSRDYRRINERKEVRRLQKNRVITSAESAILLSKAMAAAGSSLEEVIKALSKLSEVGERWRCYEVTGTMPMPAEEQREVIEYLRQYKK